MSSLVCEYTVIQKRRGPRSHTNAQQSRRHGSPPRSAEGLQRRLATVAATQTEVSAASLDSDQESRADFSSPPTWQGSATITLDAVSTSSQTRLTAEAAHAVWAALLSSISTAVPLIPVRDIVNHCIDLYMQYTFPSSPIVHEATVRDDALTLFSDTAALVTLFSLHDEHQTAARMRAFALLAGLCASVSSVVPGSLLAYGSVISGPFLRASRDMLHIYEEYDFEYPNSSSLTIRILLSTAYQSSLGKTGAAFSVLGQATLIAQSLQLHLEESVIREDRIESQLLRLNFWVLYLSDKSAASTDTRPCILHEYLFNGDLTLHPQGEPFIHLLDASLPRYRELFEERLMTGFQLMPRLWSTASELILDMKAYGKMGADRESCTVRMSREYPEFVSIIDNLPSWLEVSNLVAAPNDDAPTLDSSEMYRL
ncbi:hypothetical protein G7Z17_g692 [Cylindrodendrum hubeiense]|uniref:Xylanolytic transcriptional activator regulatory domain-containing protein n=1 Tax=Cylindrodendrum hubeiense TaxID=595255 RepID=A0A9P5HJU7_9HYPO|nr:hypothetical protein G7Z17_g692 [Cylindrodendrum hubeiense]